MANPAQSTTVDLEQYLRDLDEILNQQTDQSTVHEQQLSSSPLQDQFSSNGYLQLPMNQPCDIQVDILDLKEVYDKIQRKQPSSEQRITGGKVNMVAKTNGQVKNIRVFVRRSPQAAQKIKDKLGPVELSVVYTEHGVQGTYFFIDLDSVYKTPTGEMVYWLDKVEVDERNIWQLLISIELIDDTTNTFYSKYFRIRTKPRTKREPSGSQSSVTEDNPAKRKRSDPSSCAFSGQPSNSPYHHSDSISYSGYSPGGGSAKSDKVLTDYLEAQRARIQHLEVLQSMSTPSADIAYHLRLTEHSRNKQVLEEGDVIAFLTNPNTGETEIEKLSDENCKRAVMAGVISRSAYLYANMPVDENKRGGTDTVCVIGLVKVKVMGTVQNGERIYTALDKPGVAVPGTQIPLRRMRDRTPTLLGQSLESRTCKKLDTVHLVNCFVSIVLGIQSHEIADAINDVQDRIHVNITNELESDRRRRLRGLGWKMIPVLSLVGLLIFMLFELFAPGSLYHYWKCKKGSIAGHTASFKFSTYDHQYPLIHGVEYQWPALKRKLSLDSVDPYTGKGAHYYLNLDRCAYGGVYLAHHPQIRGPEMFVVNSTCTGVLYEEKDIWKYYQSAEYIKCNPAYS